MQSKRGSIFKTLTLVFIVIVFTFSPVLSYMNNMQPLNDKVDSLHLIGEEFGNFDSYADDIIEPFSIYYTDGDNALGETDGIHARIFTEYGAGYITLDMGRYEEILNDTGDDFTVISNSGNYSCWVGNYLGSPFTPFTPLGMSSGNTSFDLSSVSYVSARYVRIQYYSGIYVELDAIEAIYHNIPDEDNESPLISGPGDFWIWDNQTSFNVLWYGSDLTPFKYSIVVNQEEIETGEWDDDIFFTHFWTDKELQNVTLILYDIYGNSEYDSVLVEILDTPAENTGNNPIIFISSIVGIIVIVSIFRRLKIR